MNSKDKKRDRVNRDIRVSTVLLIDENGNNLGQVKTFNAIKRAEGLGLDLVEVSVGKDIPVCRIIDYGKWKYDQSKRLKNKKQVKKQVVKEIKFRPNTGDNDIKYRVKHAQEFLRDGNKVKLTVRFKGRELEHMFNTGKNMLEKFLGHLDDSEYNIEGHAKVENRAIALIISPGEKGANSKENNNRSENIKSTQ